jgi:hypothetical protein
LHTIANLHTGWSFAAGHVSLMRLARSAAPAAEPLAQVLVSNHRSWLVAIEGIARRPVGDLQQDDGRRRRSAERSERGVERIDCLQPREAGKVSVGRRKHRAVLDGQRGEVGIAREWARDLTGHEHLSQAV